VPPESSVLLDLAESIADGTPVDWTAAETRASVDERPVIRQLRVLSELASLHRSNPGVGPALREPDRHPAPRGLGRWGHLALLSRLGGGTYSDVYRAWDPQLEREVALKLLRGAELSDNPETSRITREGRLLARVQHRHVVSVYGAAVNEGRPGLWMELVHGSTLEHILLERGWFSARETMLIGIDLCGALAAIHAAGLVHGDIKTQNVLREDGGRIVLMDMGAGDEARGGPDATYVTGTPLYLPPETFTGAAMTAAGDVYSLGVLLYRLVTGGFPVAAVSLEELRQAHATGRHTRLRDARPDLPAAFVRAVERATAPDPAGRYRSAGAFEGDLLQAFEDPEDESGRVSRSGWNIWRNPAFAATAALVVLLAGIVPLWRQGRLPTRAASNPGAPALQSIAVLPFANASNDPGVEYLVDGMTDELIARLEEVPGLDVISRSSIAGFKQSKPSIPEVAQRLGVDAVLHGSVLVQRGDRRAGNGAGRRVRVTARLIAAGTNSELWNRTFDAPVGDVLALQNHIALAVVDAARLPQEYRAVLVRSGDLAAGEAGAPDAVDLYLRGRFFWHMRTNEGLIRSVQYFQEAIERDPEYSRAYAGLADAYCLLGWMGIITPDEAFDRAHAAALQALDLEPGLPEALASLGVIQMRYFDWDSAGTSFHQAIEAKPGYSVAYYWYSSYLAARGRLDEALDRVARASTLNPLSPNVAAQEALLLLYARRPDEALAKSQRLVEAHPNFARGHLLLAEAYRQKGQMDRALRSAQDAIDRGDHTVYPRAHVGVTQATSGRRSEALKTIANLRASFERGEQTAGGIACIYSLLGDKDAAFEWLERARERRDPFIAHMLVNLVWDPLRSDARFRRIVKEMGLGD
jgi:eukaryotic-like serine/threonine-protein kinase